jgi:hypothetical protein
MQEEGEREGNEEGRDCGFIAKFDGLFYVWILPIFHRKLSLSLFGFCFVLSCVRVALYR